jgi:hypothetical protein
MNAAITETGSFDAELTMAVSSVTGGDSGYSAAPPRVTEG